MGKQRSIIGKAPVASLQPSLPGCLWELQLLSFPFVQLGSWEGAGCDGGRASKRGLYCIFGVVCSSPR